MADTPPANHAEEAAKRRFQEALEKKARSSQARTAHEEGRLKVKNMSGNAGQKKFFRRKTG
ncbi:DUF5302 domain-containing protein [Streptomyces europaeiscabiei]|uniref:DUF5302 domain-containing protein n=1 Tax=Streptomyces europaeiscabiei TaxID=146819 RepID=A0ABU4NWT7_9ACTN|nr:DUF5302 domain-containing protein [Streptomyces europaeiscabiei]MDX2531381.1 DUF5302 domain-containing protein [Streptomyces europaeiscabiei]MDX2762728.1 DUF5302 domain-containing protein [Streptomyces europaeiscabiei]MDX2772538.1 DUF5302 domain-containing protein [Streptomyces europaeiscabiei]MDX3549980.1 DUF5302 domain-containing protein [Streptomyces europaeiscabiei]MDX3559220.1 DUF5302 domain-containing protein [Streptomyces europaeiscabiei]